MLSLYRTLSFRYLQQRWPRALLIVASIALGVATLVATRALNESMWMAARAASTPLAGAGDLHVTNGESGVRRDLAAKLAKINGVRAVEPLVVGRIRLPDFADQHHALVLGIVWKAESVKSNPWGVKVDWTVAPESLPLVRNTAGLNLLSKLKWVGFRPVLVGTELARELGSVIIRVQPPGRKPVVLTKVGTIRAEGPVADLARNVLIMDADDAAELLGQPDLVNRIDLFLDPNADRDEVRARVKAVLKNKAAVRTPEESDERVADVMAGLQLGFSLCGASALVVGLFLVYNALAVSVAERRHEMGILRSLGATRSQVWRLFVGEAGFLGLAGASLGVPAGLALAQLGLGPLQQIVSDLLGAIDSHGVAITWTTAAIAVWAGVATAIFAASVPALRASREQPANAVRRFPPRPGLGYHLIHVISSAALLGIGVGAMFFRSQLPPRVGVYGGFVLVLLGLLLTTPLLAAGFARLLQPLARSMLGIEGRLAADNLVRSPARTGLVITAVAAGVAMFLQSAGVIRSNEDPIFSWIDQSIAADLFVTSGSHVVGGGQNLLMPEELASTIEKNLPGVEATLPLRSRLVDYGDTMIYLEAVEAGRFYKAHSKRGAFPGLELFPRLAEAGVARAIVSQNFAALHQIQEGDRISLRGPHGEVNLLVIGTVVDYSWNRGSVIVDRARYQQYFDDHLVDAFGIYLRPGQDAAAAREEIVRRWGAEHALLVLTQDESRQMFKGMVRRLYGVAYSQEMVVGLVAALGVLTALLISVLQRRRELGVLRSVGATRSQILRSVLAEATFMGAIGAVIGFIFAIPVEWYIVRYILLEETGFYFPVCVPWFEAAAIALIAILTATLAGLGPALRTSRLRITEAIAYE